MSVLSIGKNDFCISNTELDYHVNMVVFGNQAFVFSNSGQYANMQAFAVKVQALSEVPIVDAVIAYYCPHSGDTYLLVVRNALCVPSMDNNLVPPFILREDGLILNYNPKIHCEDPSVEYHSLLDQETGLRIHFTLSGTFLVFETRSITNEEIEIVENYPTLFLTPDSKNLDPYNK